MRIATKGVIHRKFLLAACGASLGAYALVGCGASTATPDSPSNPSDPADPGNEVVTQPPTATGPVSVQSTTSGGVAASGSSASVAVNSKVTFNLTFTAPAVPQAIAGSCPIGELKSYDPSAGVAVYETGPITAACTVAFTAGEKVATSFANPFSPDGAANAAGNRYLKNTAPFTADNRKLDIPFSGDSASGLRFISPPTLKSAFDAYDPTVPTPEYAASETVTGSCPQGKFVGGLYVTGAISSSCTVTFAMKNPCGDTGLADPSTITFTKASSSATDRIDRIMIAASSASIAGVNSASLTGVGKASCTFNGCHGKNGSEASVSGSMFNDKYSFCGFKSNGWEGDCSTGGYVDPPAPFTQPPYSVTYNGSDTSQRVAVNRYKYDSKYWRVIYDFPTPSSPEHAYIPDISKGHDGDLNDSLSTSPTSLDKWKNKLLFMRRTVFKWDEMLTEEANPAWHAYDPLNSRFYRKTTRSHYRSDFFDVPSTVSVTSSNRYKSYRMPKVPSAPTAPGSRPTKPSVCHRSSKP